jgi:FAD binding domain
VIAPGDAAYEQARFVFSGGIGPPAGGDRPAHRHQRRLPGGRDRPREGLELAVRSGGHSLAGHSTTDGGILMDLADMHALEIDPQQRTARAQTG